MDCLAERPTVHSRHFDVRYERIRRLRTQLLECLLSIGRRIDVESGFLQCDLQHAAHRRLVVYKKYFFHLNRLPYQSGATPESDRECRALARLALE